MKLYLPAFFLIVFLQGSLFAQETAHTIAQEENTRIQFAAYDGIMVAGYVDHGAFLNFTGPNVSWSSNKTKIMLGMLPSLRFKEDKKEVKNAFVTPTLGVGLTYVYKKVVLQLPLYYNAKTGTENGKWNAGIGIGIKLKS
jgi:hypothetical protein